MARSANAEANLALVRRFFECYATDDVHTLRAELLALDSVWHVSGRHPLAGRHWGADEIVEYYRRLASADLRVDVLFLKADTERVVEVHRVWTDRDDGNNIDMFWVVVYRIENGRIAEVQHIATDQRAADVFFSRLEPAV